MSITANVNNKRLPVAAKLSVEEYKQLLTTYARHNSSMGLNERKLYTVDKIVKVERGESGNLHAHYSNGEWWHYTPDYTWY